MSFLVSRFCTPPEVKFDAFGTSKHAEGKLLSKIFFATLISTLGRFNRANKKICHIHFKCLVAHTHNQIYDLLYLQDHIRFPIGDLMCHVSWVKTDYSLTSIKQPPSNKRPLSKVRICLLAICCTWYLYSMATSIKWPWPPFCCRKCIIYVFFLPPLTGQQIIFQAKWWHILS